MKLSFHGAAGGVTGSCHLLEVGGRRILIDCGLFQGRREIEEENREPFGFAPASLDAVLLTHAHLDHCGRLPLLVQEGFAGPVITTAASLELVRLVLLDAAHLQEEEAERNRRRAQRRGRDTRGIEPLYTVVDAMASFDAFARPVGYKQPFELVPGVTATFFDAGHILGSASILLEIVENGRKRRLVFSGDIGNLGRPILRPPEAPPAADVVVMETTYGGRLHKTVEASRHELYDAVRRIHRRGGNVVIPTFALERAQEVLYFLRQGLAEGELRQPLQVFLDSPMAISATNVFRRHPEAFDNEAARLFADGEDPFVFEGLKMTREAADSRLINEVRHGAVVMAGSGMCVGGRVRHHLRRNLWRPESGVVFVGYASHETLAGRIIDGAREVTLFGETIPVAAEIVTIGGFSAHADQAELLAWREQAGRPELTILVHGDPDASEAFAAELAGAETIIPQLHDTLEL